MRKYRNRKVTFDGHRFDSVKECERYIELKALLNVGRIADLQVHPRYTLTPMFTRFGRTVRSRHYTADFSYIRIGKDTHRIVEDVKSPVTKKLDGYRLRVAILQWIYPEIEFVEV